MNARSGVTILEIVVALGVVMICFSFILPIITPVSSTLSELRQQLRHQTHLNWISDQVCDDIQFSGPSTLSGSTIYITATPIIQYELIGTTFRRKLGGSIQTLSSFPITEWTVQQDDQHLSFHIATAIASANRTCLPW